MQLLDGTGASTIVSVRPYDTDYDKDDFVHIVSMSREVDGGPNKPEF